MAHKVVLSLLIFVSISCLLVAEESGSRFVLETHSVDTVRTEVPVTFKLDTTTGDIWRYSGVDFVQIPVTGTWSSGVEQRIEEKKEKQRQREAVINKMKEIIIPEIEFRQVDIRDVINFLVEASKEFDTDKKGVNIILNIGTMQNDINSSADPFADSSSDNESEIPLITFSARDISLYETLKIVMQVSYLRFIIKDNNIFIVPYCAPSGEMICRMYDLLPSTFERIKACHVELSGTNQVSSFSAEDWKDFFSEFGVRWPMSTTIKLIPSIGKIMVCNTYNNLAVFEKALEGINSYPPRPGRFLLLSMNMKSTPALLLIDSDTGNAWQYEVNEFDGVKREIVTDTFMSIPVREQKNE